MKVVVMVLFFVICFRSYGQNNQIKLYIQQIAANKVYIEYLRKGYAIVQTGLKTIGDIKSGHFNLDIDFFDGLEKINPEVRNYANVADIISLNIQTVKRTKKLLQEVRGSDLFTERTISYAAKATDALLIHCSELVNELATLLKSSELKMSDDERIKRINELYRQSRDNYAFVNYFSSELQKMQLQKEKELRDAHVLKDLLND